VVATITIAATAAWYDVAMSTATSAKGKCGSCYGQGEVPTDAGPAACPDCGGTGVLPPQDVLVEWRLRAIEKAHGDQRTESAQDVRWLAFELRRSRAALLQVLALSHDLGDDEPLATRIRFLANDALGVYASDKPTS
jgi:hypothetical protein